MANNQEELISDEELMRRIDAQLWGDVNFAFGVLVLVAAIVGCAFVATWWILKG